MKRNLIIGLAAIFVISVLGLIFSGKKGELQIEEIKIFPVAEQKQTESETKNTAKSQQSFEFGILSLDSIFEKTVLEQNRKTFKEIGIKFEEFKHDLKQAIGSLPSFSETAEEPSSFPSQISPTAPQKTASTLSEKEIFAKLYPDYFTNALLDIQNVFIEFGYLEGGYKKIEKFDTEEKIFSFINTGTDVFEKQGWYTKEEAEKFRRGTNETWKKLMEKEKLELQGQFIKSEFYKNIFASKTNYFNKSISKKISEIFNKLTGKIVYAASVFDNSENGDGPGECWKGGNPLLPVGVNLIALCCDCGLGGKDLDFIEHCGANGESCAIQLGCLNRLARFKGFSAIWDSDTGICGVG